MVEGVTWHFPALAVLRYSSSFNMLHPVQQRVREVNRRVRRLTALHGVAASLLLVVVTAFLIGLLDYLLRFEDPGVRLLGSATVAAVAGWSFWRFLRPGCGYRPSDLQIAQWIEQRFPELHNRLSSGLAFVAQSEGDGGAGSPDLRRAVVAQAAADLQSLDVQSCVDARQPRRTALTATVVCLLVGGLCALDPASSALAARRLAMPWSRAPWPRLHELAFLDPPTRLAAGSDFEVELIDGHGELPEAVEIHYWFDGDSESEAQTKPMSAFNDRMVHRLENVQRSFQYRATGGDDDTMPWIRLEVVQAPRIEQLTLELQPPEYTGWPVETSGENLYALEGTSVVLQGRLDKPATAVTLKVAASEGQATKDWSLELSQDGLTFALAQDHPLPWILQASGRYWFEVTDPQGLRGRDDRVWTVRVVPDAVPAVSLEKPGANTFVTATAIVPIRANVKDDLALHAVAIRFRRGDQQEGEEQTLELYRGSEKPPAVDSCPLRAAGERGETRTIEADWDLSQLAGLAPGMWIDLVMVAEDYKPQTGQSTPRRLTIISSEELEERLAARQSYILGQLAEILRMQQDTRTQTRSLEIELDVAGMLDNQDVDQLQSAELNQRQIGRRLADPADGVAAQITAVLDELTTNRVDNPETMRRMTDLLAVVNRIGHQDLPEIQRQLINALKVARTIPLPEEKDADEPPIANGDLRDALASAGRGQDEVIALLEDLLGDLSQWDSYRRFAREVSRIRREQQTITEQTDQLRLDTLGQRPEDLSPQDKAGLKRQSERQAELARRLDKILGRMDQVRGELVDTEPLAAEMLADALHLARQTAISGQMRESGRQIEANQLGQAVDAQRQVEQNLEDLLDALANRREHELDRRVQGLQQAEQQLEQLRRSLQQLHRQLEKNAATADPEARRRELERLTRQAEELAEEAKRLGRRLERLQAQQPAELLKQASSHLQDASRSAQQEQAQQAAQQTKLAEQALEQAQQQLQAQRQQAEKDLFQEMMARLQQQISSLLQRQQGLLETTTELETVRAASGEPFSRAQLSTIRDLATAQRGLTGDTTRLADQVEESRVFAEGFRGVAKEMDHASRGLEGQQTGDSTQRYQRNALTRLEQLVEALKQDPDTGEQSPQQPPPGQPPQDQAAEDAIQRLAELKLLKWMQIEVNRQTSELEQVIRSQDPDAQNALLRLDELAAEQGRLADLMLDLSRESVARPEDMP